MSDLQDDLFQRANPFASDSIDTSRPNAARLWNYWLGGKDHYLVDRAVGDAIAEIFPQIRDMAVSNKAFTLRVVPYLTSRGITQFIDIGCGLPVGESIHEIARRAAPRVVYVDNDPMALAYARALLADGADTAGVEVVDADLRDVDQIINSAPILDFSQPIAAFYQAVLSHVPDDQEALAALRRMVDALPSGSFVVITHITVDGCPAAAEAMALLAERGGPVLKARTRQEITQFAAGLEMVEPGVIWTPWWRPFMCHPAGKVPHYALVACKP